jgi:hypothetical protein
MNIWRTVKLAIKIRVVEHVFGDDVGVPIPKYRVIGCSSERSPSFSAAFAYSKNVVKRE